VASDVADELHLDRVIWIPAGEPPHKLGTPVTRAQLRLDMVRAAATGDPRFEVATLEIERPGPSYMVDTVRDLERTLPGADLFLILGVDQFKAFGGWREPDEIVRYARLAVMDRGGETALPFGPEVPGGRDAFFVPVRRVDVSSTDIRSRRRHGEDVRGSVPTGVWAIIERERLYSEP
jgi:nicotinate-nucleotide adenylyltransferase